jgi:hypothetical protein
MNWRADSPPEQAGRLFHPLHGRKCQSEFRFAATQDLIFLGGLIEFLAGGDCISVIGGSGIVLDGGGG